MFENKSRKTAIKIYNASSKIIGSRKNKNAKVSLDVISYTLALFETIYFIKKELTPAEFQCTLDYIYSKFVPKGGNVIDYIHKTSRKHFDDFLCDNYSIKLMSISGSPSTDVMNISLLAQNVTDYYKSNDLIISSDIINKEITDFYLYIIGID